MDRLTRYLITNYSRLMTVPEHAAYRSILYAEKAAAASSSSVARALADRAALESNASVRELLEAGSEAFFDQLRVRLMSDSRKDIVLNCCPHCGALARTPDAKQCPDCYFSWHDQCPTA